MTFDWDKDLYGTWKGLKIWEPVLRALFDLHGRLEVVEKRDHMKCAECGGRVVVDADDVVRCTNPDHPKPEGGYLRYEAISINRSAPCKRGSTKMLIKPEGAPDEEAFMVVREDTLPDLQSRVARYVEWLKGVNEHGEQMFGTFTPQSALAKLRELGLLKEG
jgi:hypothetical protein